MTANNNLRPSRRENLKVKQEVNMKPFVSSQHLVWMACLVTLIIVAGCGNKDKTSGGMDQYTCPMHPTVLSATQGACPVCGMDLVRKVREGEELKITEDLAPLLQSPDEAVVASVKTIRGTYGRMPLTLEAQGVVTYDTRYLQTISARVGGRLEHSYLRYAFQPVRKGQKVAEIYSPEMLTAQRELIFLTTHDPGNESLIKAAREKLALLGAGREQIDEWQRTKEPDAKFTLYSPWDGYVIVPGNDMTKVPSTEAAAPAMDDSGMGGSKTAQANSTASSKPAALTREGDYVSRGQTLFTIANREALRIELSLPASRSVQVRTGDDLTLYVDQEKATVARVDFVQPFFSEGEAFVKVRAYVRQRELRIGQLVRASFSGESQEALWLPIEAVYDLGTTHVAFVKERGLFKPRNLVTGVRSDGWVEIRGGLASADEVAANAAYLVDSESFVKTGTRK